MADSQERPIIVLGCPRSGTTLLQLMLHAHPRIAVPPETRFVTSVYWHRKRYGDLREPDNLRGLAEWIVRTKKTRFADLGLDAEETIDEIVNGPPTLGSALGTVFRRYARKFDKPRWGDKRPAYHHSIPQLARMFPDAQFVHLIRDGRDCVGSLKNMSWYRGDSYAAIATWAEAIDNGRAAARELGSGRFYELQYEQLIGDPEGELSALCGFLGEEFHPAMCEPHQVAGIAVPKRKKHHANTHREITKANSGAWRERLEPWEISLCETVLGRRLKRNGYELSGAPRPSAAHLTHYVRVSTRRSLSWRRRQLRDRVWRLNEPSGLVAAVPGGKRPDSTPTETSNSDEG
ncbi:sulfotransferase family protein [Halostreptopolyspora alba]|uniref:Sulfotransferase n=1 Tax=Halostreptopolyspora alba TaxID=2487137 RepID=A0A3N0EHX1_9ACTN|nr:sulfotransferase [Nocardiopsaceae bacterium YIM 96095]